MAKGSSVGCELCGGAARIYCESDRASLCWGCDHKVHGANFLVGKHTRTLLCHRCQSPTPWTSSGSRIPPCMSLCLACISLVASSNPHAQAQPQHEHVHAPQPLDHSSSSPDHHHIHHHDHEDQEQEEEEGYTTYSDDEDDEDDDDDDQEEEEEEDENQVVPWSSDYEPAMSASKASSSEAEEDEDDIGEEEEDVNAKTALFNSALSLKRKRDSVFLHSSLRNTLPRF